MVGRTPPPAFLHRPHHIPPEILKGLKFKQRSRDRHHTRFWWKRGIFNPWCGTITIVDAFAKFKLRAWLHPKNDHVTQTTALSGKISLPLKLGLTIVDLIGKFKECSFIHSKKVLMGFKILKACHVTQTTPVSAEDFFP